MLTKINFRLVLNSIKVVFFRRKDTRGSEIPTLNRTKSFELTIKIVRSLLVFIQFGATAVT